MSPPSTTVTLGGKSSTLSSSAAYSVANSQSIPQIDSSALDKLSSVTVKPSAVNSSATSYPVHLNSAEECRVVLTVLLNKLLVTDSTAIRSTIPALVQEILMLDLKSGIELVSIDFGSPVALMKSLCQLSSRNFDEIGVTNEEIQVIEGSCCVPAGLCAMMDCCASALVRLLDAVAALSCEAARGLVDYFDLVVSGDGLNVKDEVDVAADMKVLLFGSKLTGQNSSEFINRIPAVNGIFREAVRLLHNRTRVELNSVFKVKMKAVEGWNCGKEEVLVALGLVLAKAIQDAAESSVGRMVLILDSISDAGRKFKAVEVFEKGCPKVESMREEYCAVVVKTASKSDCSAFLHGVYELLRKLRLVLAWEAALALFTMESDEAIEKPHTSNLSGAKEVNGENAKSDKKSEKKKKKNLGRGTSVIRQLLIERVGGGVTNPVTESLVLYDWVQQLALLFDPKDTGVDTLLTKIKEIVESNEVRRLPKIPKGTRDFGKEQMAVRELAFSIITGVFKRHGATALDTPVFELRETLMGKYGEDSKLIYDLADQGGEKCCLRYDLTVPFARYLAMNNLSALKRYQIAKVYRRDNPAKGRYREFYQCDFDIAGQYEVMEADFEVIRILTELLNELSIGDYEIKLNHRKVLDGMFEICGVPPEKFRTVCSSVDKLDKLTFDQVKKELVEEKGLAIEIADKIGSFVNKRGSPLEILADLKKEGSPFLENSSSSSALNDLENLFNILSKARCLDKIVFDLSLARGLDYYTGVIFEAVFKGATQVGTIAAGGRYDNLVGMFSGKQVPAVGVSLGIERVFTIMEQLEKDRSQAIRATETQVLVAILGKDVALAAELVSQLWDAKIKAEHSLNKRVMTHIARAKQAGIPWMVIVGESELNSSIFKLKNIDANKEEEISRDKLVEELQRRLCLS